MQNRLQVLGELDKKVPLWLLEQSVNWWRNVTGSWTFRWEWQIFEESPSEYSYSGSESSSERNSFSEGENVVNLNLVGRNNIPADFEAPIWHDVDCTSLRFDIASAGYESYTYLEGIYPENKESFLPIDVNNRFFGDDILDLIVTETNRNARQTLQKKLLLDLPESTNVLLLIVRKYGNF